MFMTGMFNGTLFNSVDPEEEREPPPPATPITFPTYQGEDAVDWNDPETFPDFERLFGRILKVADIKAAHLQSLNVEIHPAVSIARLVPSSHVDPPDLTEIEGCNGSHQNENLDPERGKLQKDLDERLKELDITNDTAFQILTRRLRPNVPAPRLAYMRKFWTGLENMSSYWDCSLDQYREIGIDEVDESAKRQRVEAQPDRPKVIRGPFNSEPTTFHSDTVLDALPRRRPVETQSEIPRMRRKSVPSSETSSSEPAEGPTRRYKGRRTGTGRDMPEPFRADTARAFVEAAAIPFKCVVAAPRHVPVVQLGRMKMPVRQTAAVYEAPKDREAARQGRLTGPLVSIQVRHETSFDPSDEASFVAKSRLDLLRVVGELLQLGQERRREGKTEIPPGTNRWWTQVPRWGASQDDKTADIENEEIVDIAEEFVSAIRHPYLDGLRSKKPRKTPAMLWKELKCGTSLWDSRTDYKAIGKVPDSSWDQLFLVSSLNHHISIVKLTVHDTYIDALTTGNYQSHWYGSEDPSWQRPKLERSHWYDLFDRSQRIEAFRGLWAIMEYLTRESRQSSKS